MSQRTFGIRWQQVAERAYDFARRLIRVEGDRFDLDGTSVRLGERGPKLACIVGNASDGRQ